MEHNNDKEYFLGKRHIISVSVLSLFMVILFTITFIHFSREINNLNTKFNTLNEHLVFNEEVDIKDEDISYTVKDYGGKIAIYQNGKIKDVLDIYTITLTNEEKKLLQEGINASSIQELNEIISCYY